MAKKKCAFCGTKTGKRFCKLKNDLICTVCCAENRNEKECVGCQYFEVSQKFEVKKNDKTYSKPASLFGSPQMQKTIMEASIDLMNNHNELGKKYDNDSDIYRNDSFEFFNTEEFNEFIFDPKEIHHIIFKFGEPKGVSEWFFTEEGTKYYSDAVTEVINETKFRSFSQKVFKIFLKYYRDKSIKEAWLLMSTINRMMENEYVIPFTILMFFRGLSKWKLTVNTENKD